MEYKRKIDELGRVVLPYEMRNALDLNERDVVNLVLEDNKIYITKEAAICKN